MSALVFIECSNCHLFFEPCCSYNQSYTKEIIFFHHMCPAGKTDCLVPYKLERNLKLPHILATGIAYHGNIYSFYKRGCINEIILGRKLKCY